MNQSLWSVARKNFCRVYGRRCRRRHRVGRFKELARKHPNFHVIYSLSEDSGNDKQWDGEKGFIHLSVDKYLKAGVRRQAFLCGPEPMIEAVTKVLEEKGTESENIFYDKF